MEFPVERSLSPVGKREHRKLVTRQELLEAGRRLFSEKGLYESRIEDLSRRAGIAKGTLYHYFRSKDDLVLAVVAAGFDELHDAVLAGCLGASTLPELAERIAAAHVSFFSSRPDLLKIFHQVRGLLKFQRVRWRPLKLVLLRHLQRLADLMSDLPDGQRPPEPLRNELAILLFGAVSGIASMHAATGSGTSASLSPATVGRAMAALAVAIAACTKRHRPMEARKP